MKLLLLTALSLSSIANFAQHKSDSAEIMNLIAKDYETMRNWDIQKHVQHCTSNYTLIENGEIWDINKEKEYYLANANRAVARKDYFDVKSVNVYASIGYTVYTLKSEITENGSTKTIVWNESVICRKVDNKWKIELIHSTMVSKK